MANQASCNNEVITIQVTCDARGLETGTYEGAVVVASNACGLHQMIFIITVEPLRSWLPLIHH